MNLLHDDVKAVAGKYLSERLIRKINKKLTVSLENKLKFEAAKDVEASAEEWSR